MAEPSQAYHTFLTHGRTYQFRHWRENGRLVTVTARQSVSGGVWLLYEHVADLLDLRYWVMPDGGISEAGAKGATNGPVLQILPPLASVHDLHDVTDGLDPHLRRQLEALLREIDRDRGE